MGKKKDKKKKSSVNFLDDVLNLFYKYPTKSYNYKQVASNINLDKTLRESLIVTLDGLVQQDVLENVDNGKYALKKHEHRFMTGTVDMTKQGHAYIVPDVELDSDSKDEDVFVSEHNLHQALNGDKVKIKLFNKNRGKEEGEVMEIIERANHTYVGILELSEKFGFVIIDSRKMPYDVFVSISDLNGAKNGQKVVVKLTKWSESTKKPTGEIIDVLGDPGNNDTEMHAILAEFDLPYSYPEQVEKLADKIPDEISDRDREGRRDFREITTFTIDPETAKDFDDALSIRKVDENLWEVGVHIADVTHYVQEDSIIDKEAMDRATSVYLVDRTIPMLPEKLSNNVCSLRPNEEKLCFSAVFEINERGTVTKEWFGKTMIFSDRRFTYEEAQMVIDTEQGDYVNEIVTLNKIAHKLRDKRFKNGAITFEREEARFNLDDNGKPVNVYFTEMKDSNHLIEEFMLLANRKVSEFIGKEGKKKAKTFIYRIHSKPNEEKLNGFTEFISKFGYKLDSSEGKNISKEMNRLLSEVKGKPEANLIETLAVRSMAKAIYSTDNIGHYGLAFDYYSHFTSPIRRYPDMMLHRLLYKYLERGKSADKEYYEKLCKHSTAMEMRAAEAERASIKYKMVEFMQDKVGMQFDGIITGVTEWGIYVELTANKIEGMVSVRTMKDDYYDFDEKNYCLVGKVSSKKYTLGDSVIIEVLKSDLVQKHLDFTIVNPVYEGNKTSATAISDAKIVTEKKKSQNKTSASKAKASKKKKD